MQEEARGESNRGRREKEEEEVQVMGKEMR